MELVKEEVKVNGPSDEPKKPAPVKYDPTKKYKWEHTDQFVISGTDFGVIMNALGTFLQIYGPPIKLAENAYEVTQKNLKYAVERGVAKEIIENEEPQK